MFTVTKDILRQVYPPRDPEAKKYDHGLLLVIGGGQFYTGSPALSAMAAFRAGIDMVRVLSPKRAADIIAGFSPNLVVYPLRGDWLDREDLPTLLVTTESAREVAGKNVSVLIGGGLGRSEETQEVVQDYLQRIQIGAVIDADGIYAVAKNRELIKGRNFVFTPHFFEFFILTGRDVRPLPFEERIKIVQEEAAKLGGIIILKGRKDIISNGHEVAINETGSPYLTVGGTGDTLAGICGCFLSQGFNPFLAGQAACYLNGRSGEMAAEKFGPGLLATDLIDLIPSVILESLNF